MYLVPILRYSASRMAWPWNWGMGRSRSSKMALFNRPYKPTTFC